MKNFLIWKEKQSIVAEAYSKPNNIKPTSRKYNVGPAQIQSWKKQSESLLGDRGGNKLSEGKKNHILKLKMKQKGRPEGLGV